MDDRNDLDTNDLDKTNQKVGLNNEKNNNENNNENNDENNNENKIENNIVYNFENNDAKYDKLDLNNINDNDENISVEDSQSSKYSDHRKKRIKRLKTAIVMLVVVFLIVPTFLCIILGMQVSHLQKQMKELMNIHSQYGLSYEDGNESYAYAAEIPPEANGDDTDIPTSDNDTNIITEQIAGQSDQNLQQVVLTQEENTVESISDQELNSVQTEQNETTSDPNLSSEANVIDDTSGGDTTDNDGIYAGKKVYLTFDDGPSIYTNEILDILNEYNVKASFFVIGKTDDSSKDIYQRIVNEGHILGMHSYSHKYKIIYNSLEDFDKDFTKLWKLLYDTTGYKPTIYRFPGGSDNLVNKHGMDEFIKYLNDKSIVYFDWNVINGDATGVDYTEDQLIDNVLKGVTLKSRSIVLMHDSQSKKTTVDSLPELLEQLIQGGAQVLPLDKDVSPIQMIKADSIK